MVLKPLRILVQVGLGGDVSIPQNLVVSNEIDMRGSFRFHEEFGLAVDMINRKAVNVKPLLSSVYPLEDVLSVFAIAGARNRSMKVQLSF